MAVGNPNARGAQIASLRNALLGNRAIRAGDLRHVCTLQSAVETQGVDGGLVVSYATVQNIRCKISPVSGGEVVYNQSVRASTSHVIETRTLKSTIAPTGRLIFGTRILQINAPPRLVDEIQHRLLIECVELFGDTTTAVNPSMTRKDLSLTSDEIDFLSTQTVSLAPASGKFYCDSVELVCTQLTGVIVTQPTIKAGTGADDDLFVTSRVTTQLTAANTRQKYSGFSAAAALGGVGALTGETNALGTIATAATGPTVFKGCFIFNGYRLE